METAQFVNITEEVIDFLISAPTLEQILAFHASETAQARLRMLLDRNRENSLTDEEREELDEMSRLNHLFILLKGRTRKKLNERQAK